MINTKASSQVGNSLQLSEAKERMVGIDGRVEGHHYDNPILNAMTCDVKFPDG